MNDIAIRVEGFSKLYHIGSQQNNYQTLRENLAHAFLSPFRKAGKLLRGEAAGASELDEAIWALKDVSFEVTKGEVVGVIGRNGAGKSTLLKMLSRITEPTTGYADIRGRVGSLLEVGTGFHPELTGRENIYLNGAILGMKRTEINRKFDEIVAFSEVEKFIDTAVKRYSSGMHLRLAFAVAAHLETEIMIIDEVLAVGDAGFQKKCLGKMAEVATEGRTILFVSHNLSAVQALCSSAILLDNGELVLQDSTDNVIRRYLHENQSVAQSSSMGERTDRRGNSALCFTGVIFYDGEGKEVPVGQTGNPLTIGLQYQKNEETTLPAVIRIAFKNMFGQRLFMCLSRCSHRSSLALQGTGEVLCQIPKMPLLPGRYTADVSCKIDEVMADNLDDAFMLDVVEGDFYGTGKLNPGDGGNMVVTHSWELR